MLLDKLGSFFGKAFTELTPTSLRGEGMIGLTREIEGALATGGVKAAGKIATARNLSNVLESQQSAFYGMYSGRQATAEGLTTLGISGAARPIPTVPGVPTLRQYFSGMNYRDHMVSALNLNGATIQADAMGMRRRMITRLAVPGALATGFLASSIFGNDNPISQASRFAVGAAVHGAIGTGLAYRVSPVAGMGYLGISAFNAMKPGNNWGPF